MNIQSRVNTLKAKIRDLGSINIDAIEEYKQLNERFEFLSTQKNDLEESEAKLQKVITDMTAIMKKEFFVNNRNKLSINKKPSYLQCNPKLTYEKKYVFRKRQINHYFFLFLCPTNR